MIGKIQCVSIDGVKSTEMELACGSPQGSILGPHLCCYVTSNWKHVQIRFDT